VRKSRLVSLSVLLAVGATSLPLLAVTASAAVSVASPEGLNRPGTGGLDADIGRVRTEPAKKPLDPTTTTITLTTSQPVVGQPIEIDVNVFARLHPFVTPSPTGSVTVSDGTHTCTAELSAKGKYNSTGSCEITEHAPGTYTFNAAYSGSASCAGSATATGTPVTVGNRETSTTALTLGHHHHLRRRAGREPHRHGLA
jgi:hypothetical protein